jgi:hypothetical protein
MRSPSFEDLAMQLYIGNKNYSSWSMRPWVLMTEVGIPFEEIRLRLDWDADSEFKKTLRQLAPTGRVPLLIDDGFAVWDTLANRRVPRREISGPAHLARRRQGACARSQSLRGDAFRIRRLARPLPDEHRGVAA